MSFGCCPQGAGAWLDNLDPNTGNPQVIPSTGIGGNTVIIWTELVQGDLTFTDWSNPNSIPPHDNLVTPFSGHYSCFVTFTFAWDFSAAGTYRWVEALPYGQTIGGDHTDPPPAFASQRYQELTLQIAPPTSAGGGIQVFVSQDSGGPLGLKVDARITMVPLGC